METWMAEYEKQLRMLVAEHPEKFPHSIEQIPLVLEGRRVAFAEGSFNHSFWEVAMTCRSLGIKQNKKAIKRFLEKNP